MRLKDKVAIITGGASGIGKATAILFAEHGAKIVVADIDENGANETVANIREAGNEAIYVQTDVTISDNTERMVQETLNNYGKLDILLSSAGIAMRLPVADLPEEDWHRCLNVNLTGVYLCAKFRAMQKNVEVPSSTCPQSMVSWGQTFGQCMLLQRRRDEPHSRHGTRLCRGQIRVNCICPGFVDTPLVAGVIKTPEEYRNLISTRCVDLRSLSPTGTIPRIR